MIHTDYETKLLRLKDCVIFSRHLFVYQIYSMASSFVSVKEVAQ